MSPATSRPIETPDAPIESVALRELLGELGSRLEAEAPLGPVTYWRIGGPALMLVQPGSERELSRLLRLCRGAGVPVHVIGAGSNLLVSDEGVSGVVVRVARSMNEIVVDGRHIEVEAGAMLPQVAHVAHEASLSGLEFALGIPGAVGGAIVMNAGLPGHELGERVEWVRVLDENGAEETWDRDRVGFEYRHSALMGGSRTVTRVRLALEPGEADAIHRDMMAFQDRRKATQPLTEASSGSVFKNPEGHYAARLLDLAGAKGMRVGEAEVSLVHANFIVNRGEAKASDVLALITTLRDRVRRRFGVVLEPEVHFLGFARQPMDLPDRITHTGRPGPRES